MLHNIQRTDLNSYIDIKVELLENYLDSTPPEYATEGSSGFDLKAAIDREINLVEFNAVVIPTGIKVAIPPGYEMQIRSRSGLSSKFGIIVLNSPGTIDSDYRGEIKVILYNSHPNYQRSPFVITPGMKIAQGVICPVYKANFVISDLDETERSDGGFGHSGL